MSKRINVLGVGVSVTNMKGTLKSIEGWIHKDQKHYICVTGVHGVMESLSDSALKDIHNRSGLTVPDGRPLFWLGRLAGNRTMGPVPGEQLSLALCEKAAREGWRLFFYGGGDSVAQQLASALTDIYPGLNVVGSWSPPFRPLNANEERALIEQVKQAKPDIIWIGLSTPKQERFMAEFLPKLDTKVMIGFGAVFDYHTGRISRTPEFIRSVGMAWFYRLCCEPRRLWKRYLINNPKFVGCVLAQKLGIREYPMI